MIVLGAQSQVYGLVLFNTAGEKLKSFIVDMDIVFVEEIEFIQQAFRREIGIEQFGLI